MNQIKSSTAGHRARQLAAAIARSMRKASCCALVCAASISFAPGPALAQSNNSPVSELSAVIVVTASVAIIVSPVILSVELVRASERTNTCKVQARDQQGRPVALDLPQKTVTDNGIKPGDALTTTPKAGGAMLNKDGKPIAFLISPDQTKLTGTHEITN